MTDPAVPAWRAGSIDTPIGPVSVAGGPSGIFRIALASGPERLREELEARLGPPSPRCRWDDVEECLKQIDEYFAGTRKSFRVRLDRREGTRFSKDVWNAMKRIPYGRTRAYGEIAERIGRPGAARAIGQACGANPLPLVVPCHRVVAAGGGLGGFGSGLAVKRWLLDFEEKNR
jgi:methylated-DNA-[protein]-cysteine S-methyltransferase